MIFDSYIGTGDFGQNEAPNGGAGIYVGGGAYGNTIGGSSVLFGNVISGNIGPGIVLTGGSFQTSIVGNDIGTDPTGTIPLPNGGPGVYIKNSTNNNIGDFSTSDANVISFNIGGGIVVASGNGNIITQNSIYSNQSAGIILQPGANGNQSAPLLTGVSRGARSTTIAGSLSSTPHFLFTIEFFSTLKRKLRRRARRNIPWFKTSQDEQIWIRLFQIQSSKPRSLDGLHRDGDEHGQQHFDVLQHAEGSFLSQ